MDNTIKGSLILDKNQPDGTLLLPGCQLVLKYEHNGEMDTSDDGNYVSPHQTSRKIIVDLVHALESIPTINQPDVRLGLLTTGFDLVETQGYNPADDMHTDLVNIVNYADRIDKLGVLVNNAINYRPQGEKSRKVLKRIQQEYVEPERRFLSTPKSKDEA